MLLPCPSPLGFGCSPLFPHALPLTTYGPRLCCRYGISAGTATPSSTSRPGRQRPLLRRGPGAGSEGALGRGAMPEGGHAEHERVAAPAAEGARRRGLRHLRRPRGCGGAAGEQDHLCKLCATPITAATCELDHIVPVHQSFSAQAQNLQALCLECHRNKTALEFSHPTTLESRFSRRAYESYVESPRLPALVFKLNSHKPDRVCYGIDVVRCRKNTLTYDGTPEKLVLASPHRATCKRMLNATTHVSFKSDSRPDPASGQGLGQCQRSVQHNCHLLPARQPTPGRVVLDLLGSRIMKLALHLTQLRRRGLTVIDANWLAPGTRRKHALHRSMTCPSCLSEGPVDHPACSVVYVLKRQNRENTARLMCHCARQTSL